MATEKLKATVLWNGASTGTSAEVDIFDTSNERIITIQPIHPFYSMNLRDEFIRQLGRAPVNGEAIRFVVPANVTLIGRTGYTVGYRQNGGTTIIFTRTFNPLAGLTTAGWNTTNQITLEVLGTIIGGPVSDSYYQANEPNIPSGQWVETDFITRSPAIECTVSMKIIVAANAVVVGGGGYGAPVPNSLRPGPLVTFRYDIATLDGSTGIAATNGAVVTVENRGKICGGGGAGGGVRVDNLFYHNTFGGGGAGYGGSTTHFTDQWALSNNPDATQERYSYYGDVVSSWGGDGQVLSGGTAAIRINETGLNAAGGAGGAAGLPGQPVSITSKDSPYYIFAPGSAGLIKEGTVNISNLGQGLTVGR